MQHGRRWEERERVGARFSARFRSATLYLTVLSCVGTLLTVLVRGGKAANDAA